MNGRKKLLCLLMLALFLFSYTSINVFATGSSSKTTDNSSSSSGPQPSSSSEVPKKPEAPVSSAVPAVTIHTDSTPSSAKSRRRTTASSSVSSVPDFFFTASSETASSEILLPSVGSVSEVDPLASAAGTSSRKMNQIGMLAWVCIGLGVAVVLIVILSNRRPPRGPGRSRYHKTKRSRKKRLLNDKYYRGLNRY